MINFIIKDIMEVAGYLPIGILCGISVVVLYVICILCLERKNRKKNRLSVHVRNSVVWFILSVYIVVMSVTVFLSREPGSRQGIDMTLFGTWGITPQAHAFVIENVLLFVPFGILCPFAVTPTGRTSDGTHSRGRIASRFTVLLGFIISVGIETVQLLTERGYCQLDDIVMNTLGSLVGYMIFLVIDRIFRGNDSGEMTRS